MAVVSVLVGVAGIVLIFGSFKLLLLVLLLLSNRLDDWSMLYCFFSVRCPVSADWLSTFGRPSPASGIYDKCVNNIFDDIFST